MDKETIKKYILYPGYIVSSYDYQRHFINAPELANLYGISLNECIIVDPKNKHSLVGFDIKGLIKLYPTDGAYDVKIWEKIN